MTRDEKATVIDELSERLQNNNTYYFTDASGMTVAQINDFRRLCFQLGIDYKVYKNTLIVKALEKLEGDFKSLYDDALKGPTGILFSKESASLPARILKDFRKKSSLKKPIFKGAFIEQDIFIGEEHLESLSKLKSKEELIGDIIALLQSPAKNVISALQSGKEKLAGVVKTLSERTNN